jgi:hypothetical protein
MKRILATLAMLLMVCALGFGQHNVVLSWTPSTTNATYPGVAYNVYRGTSTGGESGTPINASPVAAGCTSPTSCSYADWNVTAGTTYFYTLKAILNGLSSVPSNEVSATVPSSSVPQYCSPTAVSGLTVWFKADAITGLSDGNPVATWPDLSGNGYNLTASGSGQPTYKVNVLNGMPVVRFNGSNSMLSATAFPFAQPLTLLMVGDSTGGSLSMFEVAPNNGYRALRTDSTTSFSIQDPELLTQTVANMANYAVFGGVFNNASSINSYNGKAVAGSVGADSGAGGIALGYQPTGGGQSYLTGDIAEFVGYNSALSQQDRQGIEGYLAWRWGLESSLALGHPYKTCNPCTGWPCPVPRPVRGPHSSGWRKW